MRRGAKPVKRNAGGKRAAGTSRKAEGSALRDLRTRLAEALAQVAATSDVLRVISSSPADLQTVFEDVLEKAVRVCGADLGLLFRYEADAYRLAASQGARREFVEFFARGPIVPSPDTGLGRIVTTRRTVQIADVTAEDLYRRGDPLRRATADLEGIRTWLGVPMVKNGALLGAIVVYRRQVRPFADRQVGALLTFADQAVIAIENARLFTETKEALDQQTATSEILRVISGSPTDVRPVFDAIVESAAHLCDANLAAIFRLEGAVIGCVADYGGMPGTLDVGETRPVTRGSVSGRAVLERRTIHVADMRAEMDDYVDVRASVVAHGFRTVLAVPLMREGEPLGAIVIRRQEVRPFSPKQIKLLEMFADQAVIAIENVRLFNELQARNRDLTDALAQQTATSEVLSVISSSPTDVRPVFDVIGRSAARLCDGYFSVVFVSDGDRLHVGATHNLPRGWVEHATEAFPAPLAGDTQVARAVRERQIVHVLDMQEDPQVSAGSRRRARISGYRTWIAVPMLGSGGSVGAIAVSRQERRAFSDGEIALLETFADQAVIAIENVRLFKELEEKNRSLAEAHARVTETLEQQTATAEILRVISSSPMDVQPTFEAIAAAATKLCAAENAGVFLFDGELIRFVAHHGWTDTDLAAIRQLFPRPLGRGGVTGRAIMDRAVAHVPDIASDPEYRDAPIIKAGFRAILSVPMLREGEPIGAINVTRRTPVAFTETQIALLRTFADQAVIAIENVRLFNELQARTRDLTRSVEQLTALGDVSRKLSSTLDLDAVLATVVTRANQLAGTDGCSVFEYDAATEAFHLRATHNVDEAVVALARRAPVGKGEGVQGRMAITRRPVQIADIAEEDAYQGPLRDVLLRAGTRAVLAVPMLREDELIGGLTVSRRTPGEFAPALIELLTTFATQSALAIQNARLFREVADKSRQLEAASRHKSEFLANMSHELRTPLNAIIGFSEVLTERMFGELNDKQDEYLRDIYASGQHLLSLINDILDLSKIEAGRMELELSEFDLGQAIGNAVTLVRERAGRRGITLGQTVNPGVGRIRGDERKIKQVLLNLLSNALKFTPAGGRVDVRAAVGGGVARISVTDTGVGIAPEDQEAIFEEFRQVGPADGKIEGTGLGLALSRRFVELHGGTIGVESAVGAGATFTFTLPLRPGGDVLPES